MISLHVKKMKGGDILAELSQELNVCRAYYLKLEAWVMYLLFRNNSIVVRKWPLAILVQVVFLRRDYIRRFCCSCQRTLGFATSSRTGDSGDMCMACLIKEHPELYFSMKEAGQLTEEQIKEVEEPLIIAP